MTKRKCNIISGIVVALTLIFMVTVVNMLNVNAAEVKDIDFNDVGHRDCRNEISEIVYDIITHRTLELQNRAGDFSSSCLNSIVAYAYNNTIECNGVSELVIDSITPAQSDTGDTVLMTNVKLQYDDGAYNKLYLFEFHVNASGDIYGYNVWQY